MSNIFRYYPDLPRLNWKVASLIEYMETNTNNPFIGQKQRDGEDLEHKLRYCLYARKSTEEDERQALSIDSQIKEMTTLAIRENLEIVEVRRESHSAKASGTRPVFVQLLQELREEKFNAILTWAPDRLSRNGGDLGALVDLIDQKKLREIRTYTQKLTNSPNDKFMLMILGSQAKLENDNKSINVKRGLKARVEMGLWPCVAPIGYLNDRTYGNECQLLVDPVRGPIIKKIFEKAGYEKWSGRKIYKWLTTEARIKSRRGSNISLSNIYTILSTPLYTGTFEYPRKSGNWYVGKHTPLITKELFETVQEKLTEDRKERPAFKDFTFTKLMLCGLCGSGISAQEKFKNISDGSVHQYIYYSCTRNKDHNCANPYLREDHLITQLAEIIDTLDINELGARHLIDREIEKHNKIRKELLGISGKEKIPEIKVKDFAKYLLKEGTSLEKRELLQNLKNRIILKDKKVTLE